MNLYKVILDDIVKRFRVDNIDALEKIMHYLISGAGNIVSYAGLRRPLEAFQVQLEAREGLQHIKEILCSGYMSHLFVRADG